ncbi:unnamed protein product, partial [Brenthis ino]
MSNITKCFKLVYDTVIIKYKEPLENLDRQISMHLQEADIRTRPSHSNGIWCPFLLPAILMTYTCFDNVSLLYKFISLSSLGLLCYCMLFLIFFSTSSEVLKTTSFSGCVASGTLTSAIIHIFLQQGLQISIVLPLSSTMLFAWLLQLNIIKCHNTFTIGEAMIMTQSVVLFCAMCLVKFFYELHSADEETEFIGVIVYTVLSTVGLIVTALYILSDSQRNLNALAYIIGSAVIFVLLMLHSILGSNCLITIFSYIFLKNNRAKIFAFWLILLVIAICVLCIRTKLAVKASTVTRKTFHVLASLVFMSGIIFDVNLMTLAAGIGLGVLIFVEALRKSGIEPISSPLQSTFLVYSDEKDCGLFAMTPLYLYIGLAFPLLVVPNRADRDLELLSGVLSIGVGDTAASWFGSKYGFNKWSGSNRTLEGTAFNILSQVGTVYALQLFGLLNAKYALLRTIFAATVSGLVEAKTDQVDNLVLPLVTMLAFQFTRIFY